MHYNLFLERIFYQKLVPVRLICSVADYKIVDSLEIIRELMSYGQSVSIGSDIFENSVKRTACGQYAGMKIIFKHRCFLPCNITVLMKHHYLEFADIVSDRQVNWRCNENQHVYVVRHYDILQYSDKGIEPVEVSYMPLYYTSQSAACNAYIGNLSAKGAERRDAWCFFQCNVINAP